MKKMGYKETLIDGILEWTCRYDKTELVKMSLEKLEVIYDKCFEECKWED